MAVLAAACLASGCVTINIYFPAAAVEKAADRIIDEVYQQKTGDAPKPPAADAAPSPPSVPLEKK
jgi:hypothetical protein